MYWVTMHIFGLEFFEKLRMEVRNITVGFLHRIEWLSPVGLH
jgi:hypothetical protein